MSQDVNNKLCKQNEILELLNEELRAANDAIDDQDFNANLVRDLDQAIIQMQMSFLEGRI